MDDFLTDLEALRVRMHADAKAAHERVDDLSSELMGIDKGLMDHVSRVMDAHAMRLRDIAGRLGGARSGGQTYPVGPGHVSKEQHLDKFEMPRVFGALQ